jgi:hypothetical protein
MALSAQVCPPTPAWSVRAVWPTVVTPELKTASTSIVADAVSPSVQRRPAAATAASRGIARLTVAACVSDIPASVVQ